MKITPTILTDSFTVLQSELDAVRESPLVESVSIDVIDGNFVDNLTVTPLDLTVADFEPIKIDFHFLTEEPMDYVYECIAIKDYLPIRRVFGQVERMSHQRDFLEEIRKQGWEGGLALDLFTPFDAVDPELWSEMTHILLMGVEAGYQGQHFNDHCLEKLVAIKQLDIPRPIHVTIDGGVKLENASTLFSYGADELIVGSELWESPEPILTLEEFYRQMPENQS